jgi:hypothetical protein
MLIYIGDLCDNWLNIFLINMMTNEREETFIQKLTVIK